METRKQIFLSRYPVEGNKSIRKKSTTFGSDGIVRDYSWENFLVSTLNRRQYGDGLSGLSIVYQSFRKISLWFIGETKMYIFNRNISRRRSTVGTNTSTSAGIVLLISARKFRIFELKTCLHLYIKTLNNNHVINDRNGK